MMGTMMDHKRTYEPPHVHEKQETITKLNNKGRLALNLLIIGVIAFAFTTIVILFFVRKYEFRAVQDGKTMCTLKSEAMARASNIGLIDYTKDAIIDAYSYDYVDYADQLKTAGNKWFTPEGNKTFLKTIQDDSGLDNVLQGRMTVKTRSLGLAQIEKEGFTQELKRFWMIHVPIVVEYYTDIKGKPVNGNRYIAEVELVQEEPSKFNLKGFSVNSIKLNATGNF